MADRVWKQALFRLFPHTNVDGEQWQRIGYGITSGNGNASGTTVVAASFPSGGADTYNGHYWVEVLSGAYKGQWRRIVDDNGSGTYTLEGNGYTFQIVSGVHFAIWKSPEPVVVVESSGAATSFVDTTRTEAAGEWTGYWVMPITGNRRGEISQITADDGAGNFTISPALSGVLAAGDVLKIGKFFEVDVQGLPGGPEYHPRPTSRVNYAMGAGTLGARGSDFSFSARPHGSGSLAASGSEATRNDMHALFLACGLEERRGTSSTVGSGSNTTAIKIATGSWENHQIGDLVMHSGNIRRITALTDGAGAEDTVTVSPALPVAPTSGDTLYAIGNYQKSIDAASLTPCGIEVEIDGLNTIMTGCKGTIEIATTDPTEFSFSMMVDHWTRNYEDAPYNPGTAYTTQGDIMGKDMMAWADTSQIDVKAFTAAVGREAVARAVAGRYGVNGRAGFHHSNYACGATYREISADGAYPLAEDRYLAGTDRALLIQCGAHANAFAIAIPVAHHIDAATPENGDGLVDMPNVLEAQDAGTGTDPDSNITKVPDWALAIS